MVRIVRPDRQMTTLVCFLETSISLGKLNKNNDIWLNICIHYLYSTFRQQLNLGKIKIDKQNLADITEIMKKTFLPLGHSISLF
jgi:hypothetical protein